MKDLVRLVLFLLMVILITAVLLYELVLPDRISVWSFLRAAAGIAALVVFYLLAVYRPQFFAKRKKTKRDGTGVAGFRVISRETAPAEGQRLFALPESTKRKPTPTTRPKLFGTAGIRGLTNIEITPVLTLKIAQVWGNYLNNQGKVALGYDTRYGAKMLAQAAATGLTSAGVSVLDCGCIPIGGLSTYITRHKLAGGIMITGSHTPYNMIGIMVIGSDGTYLPEEVTRNLEERWANYDQRQPAVAPEAIGVYQEAENPLGLYKKHLLSLVDNEVIQAKRFKVLVDAGNGTATLVWPDILRTLGLEVYQINETRQPVPARSPEPRAQYLGAAREAVRKHNCDLGVATDIDTDRVLFIDHTGRVLSEDLTGAILAREVLKDSTDKVCVTPINSSGLIERVCTQAQARLEYCRVGHPATLKVIKELKADFSYEESGKYYFVRAVPWPDGLLTTLKLLEIMARQNKSLQDLADEWPQFYQVKHMITCPNKMKERVMKQVQALWSKERLIGRKKDVTLDGLKRIYEDDAWLLIRKSGTEPLLRVYSDASSLARAEELVRIGEGIVHRAIKSLG